MRRIIEICCASKSDVINALNGGADRVELNSAFELGGLTPTIGCLIESRKAAPNAKIICMIRPRTGGFCYTTDEYSTMLVDAEQMLLNGADGLAFGILNNSNTIDMQRNKTLIDLCHKHNKEAVFHRAIDVTDNIEKATLALIDLGINRILTSGGEKKCIDGYKVINRLIEISSARAEILACGGFRPSNLQDIINVCNASQFHMALMEDIPDNSCVDSHILFNGIPSENTFKQISEEAVRNIIEIIKANK